MKYDRHNNSRFLSIIVVSAIYSFAASPAVQATETESQCYNEIQGKIAWNDGGNMNWDPENVKELCRGTTHPAEPGQCFLTVNNDHAKGQISWGKSTEWEWHNVINLCSGTSNASKTVECFNNGIKTGADWRDVILNCQRLI